MRNEIDPAAARMLVALLACALLGCTRLLASPAPGELHTIAVLPLENRTGSELFVDAPPLLAILRDVAAKRVTVTDLLHDDLLRQLAARGFGVVDGAILPSPTGSPSLQSPEDAARHLRTLDLEAAALWGRLERWDPYEASHLTYVDVALDLFLVAPDGRVIWELHWPASPFPAGGATSVTLAYPQVARRVIADAIADLEPAPPASEARTP